MLLEDARVRPKEKYIFAFIAISDAKALTRDESRVS